VGTDGAELVVSEVFGPTFQGEGPSLGRRAGFVRLGRCNLACSWCDTPYTWDWSRFDPAVELAHVGVDEVAARVRAMDVGLVVVTGGEPLLQQTGVVALASELQASGHRVEVETAGTVAPRPGLVAVVDQFNVSPKLANSGNPVEQRHKPDVLRALVSTRRAVFKFVACTVGDLDEVQAVVDECRVPGSSVWVMPEGTSAAAIGDALGALAEPVVERGWNLTTRLHVTVWGDRRGV
jgi:7-cyano-7-deazaguanosine (preQ0) biosynthesis protein QueE